MRPALSQECKSLALALHDDVLGAYPHPVFLVSGTLLDHRWVIRFGDPEVYRGSDTTIDFAVPASPGKLFTDPAYENDLLTAKLLLIHLVRDGVIGSAKVASIFVRNYLQFARWRIGVGLRRNADLSHELIGLLLTQIGTRGISGLPPVEEALAEFEKELASGGRTLPRYKKGNRVFLASGPLLAELGLPNMSSAPGHVRRRLRELALSNGLLVWADQAKTGRTAKAGTSGGLTQNRVAAFLKPIEALSTYSYALQHDPISFTPFGSRSAQSVAAGITAQEADRTATIPALQACHIVNHALVWVLEYAPELFRLLDAVQVRADELTEVDNHWRPHERAIWDVLAEFRPVCAANVEGSPWPLHPSYFQPVKGVGGRPSIRTALLGHLVTACFVVIAAFAARRHDEINSLLDDCIVETDFGLNLRSYIEKTLMDLEEIPVPYAVKAAVDVLLRLSAGFRHRTGKRWIVAVSEVLPVRRRKGEIQPDEAIRSGKVDLYRTLDAFTHFIGTPPLEDGHVWIPRPHQFRRWFGVVYMNRYRFPQLLALAHFYRHWDPNQTRRYITERAYGGFIRDKDQRRARERLREFEAAAENFRSDRFLNVVEGCETLTGFGGEAIKRELAKCIASVADRLEVVDPKQKRLTLIEAIAPVVRSSRLEPNELGYSYCKFRNPDTDCVQAECLKRAAADGITGGRVPDPAYASADACGDCALGCFFGENETYLDAIIAESEARLANCRCLSVQQYEAERLEVLTLQRDRRKSQKSTI